jgi:DNA modification methylase
LAVDRCQRGLVEEFRLVPRFPPFGEIANGELFSLSLSNRTGTRTHGLHRFAAKFVPQVPAWAIEEFAGEESVVLDPFCGSGTTLVEALSRCGRSFGVDCDPLACLVARAKTTEVRSGRIRDLGERIRQRWHGPAGRLEQPMAGIDHFSHWFSENAWGHLQSLLGVIGELDCTEEERGLLYCVFSSIVRWVSNADDQTQKTYVSGTLRKKPPEVGPTFWKALDRAVAGLWEMERCRLSGARSTIVQGDAGNIELPEGSVDLVVTSPPYVDSVDYLYNMMLEYFWLGPLLGVKDRQTFNGMRRGVIGAKKPRDEEWPLLPGCLAELIVEEEILPGRLLATRAYCQGMARHFASAARVMKPGGRYVLVIGNSRTGKGVLPVHDALIRLAADAGLVFEKAFAYRIRRHYMKFPRKGRGGIITMDWVIVMRRGQGPAAYPGRLPLPDFTLRGDEVAN